MFLVQCSPKCKMKRSYLFGSCLNGNNSTPDLYALNFNHCGLNICDCACVQWLTLPIWLQTLYSAYTLPYSESFLLHDRSLTSTQKSTMDLKEYFRRIGFSGLYEKPDLATLCAVHKLHVMSIPFENLSVHCGERNTMDLQVIYDKIVCSHRGGWCCENNFLFSWVLREMGYKYTMLGSRVFNSIKKDFNPKETHLINMIEIDGKPYIADVSFGVSGQLRHPLEMIAGKDQPQLPGVFRLLNDGDTWTLEKTGRKPLVLNEAFANCSLIDKCLTKTLYMFTLMPRSPDYFLKAVEYLQTSPLSLFTQKSICSLQLPTGFRVLVGWTYSEVTFCPEEDVDLIDMKDIPDDEIEIVLRERFNITLVNKLTPKNNTAAYKI